jgi:type VI secretion system secreted protein VgrG
MPSPKSGSAGSIVAPAEPTAADDADSADPGEVEEVKSEQIEKKAGKYGATPVQPYKPPQTEEEAEKKPNWIEIELVDEEEQPVAGEKYEITLPDGRVAKGTLDQHGFARIDGIDPGTCKVTFPNLDKETWKKV